MKNEPKYTALLNGKVITIDKKDSIAEAVLIAGDRIAAVGSNEEVKALLPKGGTSIDVGGRAVMPGIIDAHIHMELTVNHLENAVCVHLPEMKSLAEIFQKIAKRVKVTPKGEWIIARSSGSLAEKVVEGRLPTREELDKIAPDNPLFIDEEVHLTVMNTKAIEAMGWQFETWLPPNATLGRDQETGELTGVYGEVWKFLPQNPWGYDNLLESLRTGVVKHFVSKGVTSAYELPYSRDGMRAWQQLYKEGDLPLRLKFYFEHPNFFKFDQLSNLGLMTGFGDEWLSIGGLKLFADGIGVHANGHLFDDICFPQEELDEIVYQAHAAGLHIWTHTVTAAAIRMGIKAYENALKRLPKKDHRLRLEHAADTVCDLPDGDQLMKKMKKLGIIPIGTAQFIHTVIFDGYYGASYRKLIDEGFILPGNSDVTGSQPEACNPWHGIWVSVTRKNFFDNVILPEQRITPMEALRMNTMWAAYGGFEEKIKGSIEPGKLADILVLGEDPLTIDPDGLRTMPVELVIVGGESKSESAAFKGALK